LSGGHPYDVVRARLLKNSAKTCACTISGGRPRPFSHGCPRADRPHSRPAAARLDGCRRTALQSGRCDHREPAVCQTKIGDEEQAAGPEREADIRVSICARYSSDLQSAASIEDQILVRTQRISREGWSFVGAFSDRGISGASHLRPGYQALLEGARKGDFDIVVAEVLDRISRDQEHIAAFFKLMRFAGVRIVTLAEGDVSELHVGLKGTMNALFLKDIAAKTRRGLRGRVEQGRSGGGLSYGYAITRDDDGERGGREIIEAHAVVVRRIFTAFAAGKSPRKIAAELNRDVIAGPGGRRWSDKIIRTPQRTLRRPPRMEPHTLLQRPGDRPTRRAKQPARGMDLSGDSRASDHRR
jgi:DNA invertase Pin-like site-specific DNA recombinase